MIQFYVRNNILKYFKSSVLALFETTFILTFWFYGATEKVMCTWWWNAQKMKLRCILFVLKNSSLHILLLN